jgi:hypothetical protein
MGYNITKWKTEELTGLSVPISTLYENYTWSLVQPIITDIKNMETKLRLPGDSEITGHLSAGHLFLEMTRIEDDGFITED